MKKNKKLSIVTLGCPKNFVDSEGILLHCEKEGYDIVENPTDAEIIIVNTCGFIESAKQESIETILDLAQLKDVGNCERLIVTGCLAQLYQRELSEELTEADAIIGNKELGKIISTCHQMSGFIQQNLNFRESLSYRPTNMPHIAYLKIAEGCDNRCSYCLIPEIRGRYRSKPMEEILKEANRLINNGVKEINLIAQETTTYGLDLYGEIRINELLRKLSAISDSYWLRLLYTHPATVTDELIDTIATCSNICNYIDLPLQHINDHILKAMGRKVNKKYILQLIDKIRDIIPDVSLRTTFILGFPGETQAHFNELVNFMQDIKFDKLGAFTYSPEELTPSYKMKHQVPPEIAAERLDEVMFLQQEISAEIHEGLIGKQMNVLIDEAASEALIGRSYRDAPDIDGIIEIPNGKADIGEFVTVEIIDSSEYDLLGNILD